jgi:phytoene dehydrogenase-like protein
MKVAVVGAGVGGLACAVRLAESGHTVVVLERSARAGGKCGVRQAGDYRWDSGPSLLTMPWVVTDLLGDAIELVRVEPVSRYEFADGSSFDMSADLPAAMEALETWSPGAGADWVRFLGVAAGMWRAAVPVLTGPPPWPPRRPRARAGRTDGPPPWPPRRTKPPGDPRDLIRVRPWHTLRTLARTTARDPRLRLVIERFATYAGADPRRAPAALAVAGWVEHAFGAWHVRGGLHRLVDALVDRLATAGGELRTSTAAARIVVPGRRAAGVELASGELVPTDAVVANVDELALRRDLLGRPPRRVAERSLSGLAVMLGLDGPPTPRLVHHRLRFPADYDAELDDVFVARRPPRDPTLYVSAPAATDGGPEAWFVLVNAPSGVAADWEREAERIIDRLGVRDRIRQRELRTPADLASETGAVGGAIYGAAPHGRLGTLRRPGQRVRGIDNLWTVGGTVHPGGGLPLVMLGGATVAREIGA